MLCSIHAPYVFYFILLCFSLGISTTNTTVRGCQRMGAQTRVRCVTMYRKYWTYVVIRYWFRSIEKKRYDFQHFNRYRSLFSGGRSEEVITGGTRSRGGRGKRVFAVCAIGIISYSRPPSSAYIHTYLGRSLYVVVVPWFCTSYHIPGIWYE